MRYVDKSWPYLQVLARLFFQNFHVRPLSRGMGIIIHEVHQKQTYVALSVAINVFMKCKSLISSWRLKSTALDFNLPIMNKSDSKFNHVYQLIYNVQNK